MKKTICSLLSVFLLFDAFLIFTPASAVNRTLCRDITKVCRITVGDKRIGYDATDGKEDSYERYKNAEITVTSPEPIGGVYVVFDRIPPVWTLSYGDEKINCGKYGFIHEYQSVDKDRVTFLTLRFDSATSISEIHVISRGDRLPDFVQTWRPAEGPCDIMLLSCHSDDDQLFFAGSVPDAVNRGAEMQVCLFTNHWKTHTRMHEFLNGLWTCGLDRYPVIGRYPDFLRVDNEQEMLAAYVLKGYTYDQMASDQVELLRRFKPQIVLVHDINGEYGHGAHRLDSHSLRDAALLSNDPEKYPESAKKYGVWKVPKIYIHLYKENRIDFEIDTPLERFGGKTAFQVSQDAFRCHESQSDTRYCKWLLGTEEEPVTDSSGFPKYSPRCYGLWRSTVGNDVVKTDFYENIVLSAERKAEQKTPEETTAPPETTAETTSPETTAPETTIAEITTIEETTTEETTADETTTEETTTEETTTAGTEAGETTTVITTAQETTQTETDIREHTETVPETTAAETTTDHEQTRATDMTYDATETDITEPKAYSFNFISNMVVLSVCLLAAVIAIFVIVRNNKSTDIKNQRTV